MSNLNVEKESQLVFDDPGSSIISLKMCVSLQSTEVN